MKNKGQMVLHKRIRESFFTIHKNQYVFSSFIYPEQNLQVISCFLFIFQEQFCGEIESHLWNDFKPKLHRRWSLYDVKGNRHRVSVNLIGEQLFMTRNWFELRMFYNFINDQSIMFRYVGHSRFHIIICRNPFFTLLTPSHPTKKLQCASLVASRNKILMAKAMAVN